MNDDHYLINEIGAGNLHTALLMPFRGLYCECTVERVHYSSTGMQLSTRRPHFTTIIVPTYFVLNAQTSAAQAHRYLAIQNTPTNKRNFFFPIDLRCDSPCTLSNKIL